MAPRAFAAAAVAAVAAAPLAAAAPYSFVAMGDWGTGTSLQQECATRLNKFCGAGGPGTPCEAIISLGDEFYNGPNTTFDERWTKRWTDMYTTGAPWYSCMGNHDYSGTLDAYYAFARNDTRWHFDATNYSVAIPEADLTIVFVDTPRACPSYMSAPFGDCTEQCMLQLADEGCTNATSVACWDAHVAWLNATLAGITTRWKIVAGHHPVDQEHMPAMVPALAAHGVQAYLAGHVHNLQHSVGADGVQYFVSGAGAFASLDHAVAGSDTDFLPGDVAVGVTHKPHPVACPPGSRCAPSASKFLADGPGFLALTVDNDATPPTTTASFVHANGTVLYTTTFTA